MTNDSFAVDALTSDLVDGVDGVVVNTNDDNTDDGVTMDYGTDDIHGVTIDDDNDDEETVFDDDDDDDDFPWDDDDENYDEKYDNADEDEDEEGRTIDEDEDEEERIKVDLGV